MIFSFSCQIRVIGFRESFTRSFLERGGLRVDLSERLLELALPPLDVLRPVRQPHVVVKVVPLGPRLRLQLQGKVDVFLAISF